MNEPLKQPTYKSILLGDENSKGILVPNVKSFVLSELIGTVFSFAALQGLYKVAPNASKKVKDWLGENLIRPNITWLGTFADQTEMLQAKTEAEKQQCENKQVEELSTLAFETFAVAPLSAVVATIAHNKTDKLFGLQQNTNSMRVEVRAVDYLTHIGSVLVANNLLTKQIEPMRKGLSNVMQKAGFSEETAERASHYMKNIEGPNLAGATAALAATLMLSANATINSR